MDSLDQRGLGLDQRGLSPPKEGRQFATGTEDFASYVEDRRQQITARWAEAMRKLEAVPSVPLEAGAQLPDQLPLVLGELIESLRQPIESAGSGPFSWEPLNPPRLRWVDGWRLPKLLEEIGELRLILGDTLRRFEEESDADRASRWVAARRVHAFFDCLVLRAAVQHVDHLEAERRRTEEAFHQRDASRLRLLRTCAHELRNATNAVQLTVHALGEEGSSSDREELLDMLSRTMREMGELVGDLLDFSLLCEGPGKTHLVEICPRDMLRDLLSAFRSSAIAKGLRLEGECDPKLDLVVSDPVKLRQVAHNFLSNAVKYTTNGVVRMRLRTLGEDRWSLCVEDTGCGIARDECERIFNEFHRVPQTSHLAGHGLGLAIVKRLVEALHGEVQVESEPGVGSRFELLLPRFGR